MNNFRVLRLIIIICILIFIVPNSLATIIVKPTSYDLSLNKGDSRVLYFNFTSNSNISSSLAFTKVGENTDWLTLTESTASISNSSPFTLTSTLNIPSNANDGIYVMKVRYDSSEIPIILTVKKNETEESISVGKCRLEPFPTSYNLPIVAGSPPVVQQFSVLVSKYCDEEVEFKEPLIVGNTQTNAGLKPLLVYGASDLSVKEPKEEGLFSIQIDTTDLPSGTYQPYVLISANYKGEKLSERIPFTISVSQGASPLEGASELPTYLFSATDLVTNNTYTITAQNINPNYEPYVVPSEFFIGERLDVANGWVYYFRPTQIGNFNMIVYTTYRNVPIGKPTEKEIRVTASSLAQLGTKMVFHFFTPNNKSINNLVNGESFSVLVKDELTGSVIDGVVLYLNGKKVEDNTFIVEGGKTYTLTASAGGFNSIDKTFSVANQLVTVTYQPYEVEKGRNITFTTNPEDAQILLNGESIGKTHVFDLIGSYTITGKAENYQDNTFTISVTEPLALVSEIPTKAKIGEEVIIQFNKPLSWYVMYQENNESIKSQFASGGGQNYISFTPDQKGIYKVYARNDLIAIYDLTGFSFSRNFIIGLIVAVIIIVLVYGYSKGLFSGIKSGEKKTKSEPSSKFILGIPPSGDGEEQ